MITTESGTEPRWRMQGSVTVDIDAPPSTVWALLADITRMGEWSPETYRARWLDGATGPAVGVRFRGYNRRRFQRWRTTPIIRVCEPERELAFALHLRDHDFTVWRYRLEPSGDGTDLTESFGQRVYALYGALRPRRREQQLVDGMRATLARMKAASER